MLNLGQFDRVQLPVALFKYFMYPVAPYSPFWHAFLIHFLFWLQARKNRKYIHWSQEINHKFHHLVMGKYRKICQLVVKKKSWNPSVGFGGKITQSFSHLQKKKNLEIHPSITWKKNQWVSPVSHGEKSGKSTIVHE